MALRTKTTTLLGTAVLAAVLAPAASAYADSLKVDDETSDVWEAVWNEDTQSDDYVEAGSVNNVDVTSLRVRHLANRIVVTATYAELNKGKVVLASTSTYKFNDGPTVGVMLDTYAKSSGETVMYTTHRGKPVDCKGLDDTIDYDANTVELSIPRKCVGDPRWVQVGYVGTGSEEDSSSEFGYRNYRDNALDTGHTYNGATAKVAKS